MDVSSQTARLCLAGTQAEFRDLASARGLFAQAWDAADDDYERAIAAHYVAHLEEEPARALEWHRLALEHGRRDERAAEFLGSLLVSLGGAHKAVGDMEAAEECFRLAAAGGVHHERGG